jgi:hypothetical protein
MYKQNVRRIALAITVFAAVAPSAALASTGARKHHHTLRHHHSVRHARAVTPSISTAKLTVSSGALGTIPVATIGGGLTSSPKATAFTKVQSFSSGEPGSATDETCGGLASQENDALDHSSSEFDMGDDAAGVKWYGIASDIQDYALTQGCVVVSPID